MKDPVQSFKRHLRGAIHATFPTNPWFILLFSNGPSGPVHKVFLSFPFEEDFLTGKMAAYLVPKLPHDMTEPVYRRDVSANLSETTVFITHDLTVPLHYENHRIGLFWVGSQKREGFSPEQRETITQFAALLGFMIGVFATCKRHEEDLIYSESRFKDLIENLSESVFLMDTDRLVYANASFCALVSSTPRQVAGTPIDRWIHPDDREAFRIRMRRLEAGDFFPSEYEVRLVGEKGSTRLCLFGLRKVRSARSDLYVGTLQDITNIRSLWEQLFEAQKMSALSTFSSGIAHDFNNILGGILGYASLIKSGLSPKERIYPFVEAIERSSHRAATLVQQLLGFTSGGRYQEIPFVLQGALHWLKDVANGRLGDAVRIILEMTHEPLMVFGDMDQIRQAFLNICLNAGDAMPQGGTLKISLTKRRISPAKYAITRRSCLPGVYAEIRFEDTGVGMDEAVLEKIFDPFFTTKEVGKGIGLGLSMTYGIVKGHGGCVEVESTPGEGTRFKVYLPLYEPAQEEIPGKGADYGGKGERILVVGDNAETGPLIKLELERNGYQVTLVKNGQEGIEAYRQTRAPFDLVVLDMNMPVMDGEETFWKLKQLDPEVKTILMTGLAIDGKVRNLLLSGVLGYLRNPFHRLELLRAVRTSLDSAL